ncbi:MAG: hypothetical protein NTZ94_13805, partial [Verrucomicrobia bacterium]|nr:hypothetical protein [Verrucomicrobiota bacterium]
FYREWNPFKIILVSSLLATTFLLPIHITSFFNYLKYDFYGVVDFKGNGFKAALNALQSVAVGEPIPYVPVSSLARKQIYLHSASFRELQPNLEDENNGWKKTSSEVYPHAFNDYAGGWFMWAFRDAVAAGGYYRNGVTAEKFYSQIAAEIADAQSKGALSKTVSPVPFMPPLSEQNLMQIPKSLWSALKYTAYQSGMPLTSGPSLEPIAELNAFRSFLGHPKSLPAESERSALKIHGWYHSKNDDWLVLTSAVGEFSSAKLQRLASPDLVKHFKDPSIGLNRFSVTVFSNSGQFLESDASGCKTPIENLVQQKNGEVKFPCGTLWLDNIEGLANSGLQDKAIFIKQKISGLYQSVTPSIIYSGLACFLAIPLFLFFARSQASLLNPLILIFSIAVAVLFFCRIIIVVLVDATSFPAVNYLYLGPAFPLIPILSFTSYCIIISILQNINKKYK